MTFAKMGGLCSKEKLKHLSMEQRDHLKRRIAFMMERQKTTDPWTALEAYRGEYAVVEGRLPKDIVQDPRVGHLDTYTRLKAPYYNSELPDCCSKPPPNDIRYELVGFYLDGKRTFFYVVKEIELCCAL
jgi:hypothetical protein